MDIPVEGDRMKFSIITASFEPGKKLIQTVENILDQTFDDYEVIIKDGGSRDGSIEEMMKVPQIKAAVEAGKVQVHVQEDKNVYDGMNQALSLCQGDYLLFLNCGDFFHDGQFLACLPHLRDCTHIFYDPSHTLLS